jgi:glutathione S-transferase
MTIRHLELDVEVININFQKGENKSEEFTALNPLQQVPVLVEEDGFVLTESRAIMTYLVASRNVNRALYPLNDAVQRALVDERLYYDATTVFFSHIQILASILFIYVFIIIIITITIINHIH